MVKKRLLIVAILGGIMVALNVASHFPDFIEQYYSRRFYPVIASLLHALLNWLPFSLGDIGYVLLIVWLVYALIRSVVWLVKKNYRLATYTFLKVVVVLQLVAVMFYSFWGLNYFRPPIAQTVYRQDTSYTLTDLKNVTALLIDSVNASAAALTPADRQQSNTDIYQHAVLAIGQVGRQEPAFLARYPHVKPAMFTPALNFMSTLGYYNPFTGEAQMNYQMPVVNKPVTCCHEMGHQMGYGREDEANYIGFVAGVESGDRLLRYSAYYMAAVEFLHHLRQRDSVLQKQYKQRLSPIVKADIKADRAYWTGFESKAGILSALLYDHFLKANNQPAGLFTYNQMIRLTMVYYKHRRPGLFGKAAKQP
ncbi:DUF3810 domain-containing protein [Mucilaginibacter sp. Bleaf8]|uniref:DUF3810 domain-containing protein n=1 Tax=Mucilaginibacter sp. Bleaf8 TaxID=2834430 RepID=UPI001BD08065|nr:DUF3810 domain-containing protein [Mucilaginibacter sp. Bleaf8]MBS7564630.1 DUF3810 domain-containing protein [Mucilaginibacter sp. Bleaf8]